MTCQNCSTVDHFIYKNDYVDFYDNMYKIGKRVFISENILLLMFLMKSAFLIKNRFHNFLNNVLKIFDKINSFTTIESKT